jgi:hypothetical protein
MSGRRSTHLPSRASSRPRHFRRLFALLQRVAEWLVLSLCVVAAQVKRVEAVWDPRAALQYSWAALHKLQSGDFTQQ